jgi:hypothetical protein
MYSVTFFVVIAIVVLLFITAFSCVPPVPYVSASFFPKLGGSNFHEGFGFSEYTTYPEHASKDTVVDLTNVDLASVGSSGDCGKYQGFDGLFCNPASAHASNPTDIFSQAAGRIDCKSYGYTNSRGFLCMDDKQVQLLTTRGGNASGGDMQIGPAPKLV